ncbi:MAG: hypothetical protein NVS1B16_10050 [Pseudarthrobacter sp.]
MLSPAFGTAPEGSRADTSERWDRAISLTGYFLFTLVVSIHSPDMPGAAGPRAPDGCGHKEVRACALSF